MKPQTKFGLIAGVIGLVLTACVASFLGLCGPFVALFAGAVAGFLTAQQEAAPTKGDGARAGATSGLIAGAIAVVGQLIGAIGTLVLYQFLDLPPLVGSVPSISADASQQLIYYGSGLGTGLCFGLVGIALAALAGAAAGYFGTPTRSLSSD
ncbi:MAG: hypothetical protein JXA89_06970 [Anaerolineae bacterium]|nr:hypothetical protein [Anaerolineae bacterium]